MTAGPLQRLNFLARRPLIPVALAVSTGAAMAVRLPIPSLWLLAVTLTSGLLWFAARNGRLAAPCQFLFLCLFSCAGAQLHPVSAGTSASWVPEGPVTITGTICTDPSLRPVRKGNAWLWSFKIRDWRAAESSASVERIPLGISWYGPGRSSGPRFGETWSFEGTAKRSRRHQDVQVVSAKRKSRRLEPRQGSWLAAQCYAGRHAAERYLSRGLEDHPETSAILNALLLGYRGHLTPKSRETFTATGTLHIFAISGLHVGIVALLIVSMLRTLRVSRVTWGLIVTPLLIAYTLATGARPSALRACIMAITLFLAPLLGRRSDPASAIALAAILLLAWDPSHIQDMGFIYTFVVVTGLLILTPRLEAPLRRFYHSPDADLVSRSGKRDLSYGEAFRDKAGAVSRLCLRAFCGLAALSCAAWIVSTPLTAYWFGRVAPVALLANILVVPIAFAIVFMGCLSILCGACLPILGSGFNMINIMLIALLFRILRVCAALPLASIDIPPPPLWSVLLCYAGIGLVALILPPPAARECGGAP